MKKLNIIKLNTLLIILVAFFASCEDVIDLELKNAKPVVVIEANVSDEFKQQTVVVTQTKPFTNDNSIVPITNAVVTIREEGGLTYTAKHTTFSGTYFTPAFAGKQNKKYTVNVLVNGVIYTAVSTMPNKVPLDSLTITQLTFFGSTQKFVQINYKDPANVRNFYNSLLSVNNKLRNSYFVEEDRFNDGNVVKNTIFNDDPELKTGDKIKLEFQCIDENIYKYFFAISQISGNGGPPTAPANPDSNFSNGALGYFSAHTTQIVNATIK